MMRHNGTAKARRLWRGAVITGILLLALLSCSSLSDSGHHDGVAAYLEEIKGDPVKLEAFVHAMPKGGDIHSHLSGIPYAESFLRWAAGDSMCISATSWLISGTSPCQDGFLPAAEVLADQALADKAVNALSMRNFPLQSPSYGHDHFFAAFGLFGAISGIHRADMLAEAATRAADDHTDYLELFITFQADALSRAADAHAWTGNLEADYAALLPGVRSLLDTAKDEVDALIIAERSSLKCSGNSPPPACEVTLRFIQQATRTASLSRVFTSFLLGAEMQTRDDRLVAVDLVAPEDNASALANYRTHMAMVAFLGQKYPGTKVSLHAGELTASFVSPSDLTFHVTEAVRTAGADRIGHGVSLKEEPDWQGLLAYMAQHRIGAAMNLTSNAQILGVTGDAHPFMTYRNAGVPIVVSTDDQGVSRSSHTAEFVRAVTTYGLHWDEVESIVRNSLDISFLRGRGLWKTPGRYGSYVAECGRDSPERTPVSPECRTYLLNNDRAAEQWRLEGKLARFKSQYE